MGLPGRSRLSMALAIAPAAHKIDAGDLNDRVIGRIGAGGLDVDDADQGAGATRLLSG
jgi:hypothetical protein